MRRTVALCSATSLFAIPAVAETSLPTPTGPGGIAMVEWQGLSYFWTGVLAAAGVFYYSDVLTAAATGAVNPLLLVPIMATGFVAGCSVGSTSAAGVSWILQKVGG